MKEIIANTIQNRLARCFREVCSTLGYESMPMEVAQSSQPSFGHYQFNSVMKLAKLAKTNPREIATRIVSEITKLPTFSAMVEKVEVAGPGFINIHLKPEFIEREIQAMLEQKNLGIFATKKEKIVVDFSSPNTAKEMHVGHLRSTIIGDALARTFEFLGDDVVRLNHIGDWGTAFGMLIEYIKTYKKEVLEDQESITLQQLVRYYKEAKELFDKDPAFKKESQQEVVALQGGDKQALTIWQAICHISRKGYQEIYDLLQVHLKERGESFYNEMLPVIVQDLEKKGLLTVSEGAKCVYVEGFINREGEPLPLMVQKSDGGYTYDTTDMAALKHRIEEEKANRIIIVTDAGQATHFQMIFTAAEAAGYVDRSKVRLDHVPFGLVLGPDGKKFRTRSGETERLLDLITAAITAAQEILKQRGYTWPQQELDALAKALGIAAIKYADLSCNRVSDYTFSYDRMLRFEGNTAPFILYSYVRCRGIEKKVGIDIKTLITKHPITLKHPSEIALGMRLAQFGETIEQIAQELLPNRLTDYLYSLAETFNIFFRDCRVEGSPEQNSRLLLTELTARVLKQGLKILGIDTVERM